MEKILKCIIDDVPLRVDQHFALQKNNLSLGLIDYNFIGDLENFNEIERFLAGYSVRICSHDKHSTGAQKITNVSEVLEEGVISLIQEVYADDFQSFQYSFDPKEIRPKSNFHVESVDGAILESLLELATTKDSAARLQMESNLHEKYGLEKFK